MTSSFHSVARSHCALRFLSVMVLLLFWISPGWAISTGTLITPTGTVTFDLFGEDVAPAGDVNGDGFDDVIVGCPFKNAAAATAGQAYVYFGGPGVNATADLTMTGTTAGTRLGEAVAGAGDVNGDGFDDFIVGAWPVSRAYLFFGGATPDTLPDLTLSGSAGDELGAEVASAGDVNGDGFDDLIVGATGATATGQAYVYYGGVAPDATADLTLTGTGGDDAIGNSVASAGDVNGDGFPDLIVGDWLNDTGGTNTGRAYLYFGGPTADGVPDVTFNGAAMNDQFGYSVASAGDMNSDGFDDVIVGAQFNDFGGVNAGRAYVYFGGAVPDAVADLILTGANADDRLGWSVASARDLNLDGFGDVIVGAWNSEEGGTEAGRAYVYYGGAAPNAVADIVFTGTVGARLGIDVDSAGDVTGDGFPDLIVGANSQGFPAFGRAYVYDVNRYHVVAPNGGETWNVGALRTISWRGDDLADVSLSVDGGGSYELLRSGVGGDEFNAIQLRVPHLPTRFARVRVTPSAVGLLGVDETDSLFTIQSSVTLFTLVAEPTAQGVVLSWSTDPGVGPDGLAGYRLYRSAPGSAANGVRIGPDPIVETTYTDTEGTPGSVYRLAAVNGLGEELELGVASFRLAPLSAWPQPYRGGNLHISFAIPAQRAAGSNRSEVRIHDIAGRLVRTLSRARAGVGMQSAIWDGNDAGGSKVASGVYFLSVHGGGSGERVKLVVLR